MNSAATALGHNPGGGRLVNGEKGMHLMVG